LYGGTERVVAYLTDALVDLGHEVTLFAAADAQTKAELVPVRDRSTRLDPQPLKSDLAAQLIMMAEVRRRAEEFDVLHFHVDLLHFPLFEDVAQRTLTTLHGRLDIKDLARAFRLWPEYPLVSISDRQRRPLAFANWCGTVHHGLPPENFAFAAGPGSYLAFLGRIAPEKRLDRAIEIAKTCGIPLKIAAKVDQGDRVYFEETISPLIDGNFIEFIGEITEVEKSPFLGNARALLFPIDWPEPFGMAMIEAMACGTPVIAWNCGSVPEVVEDGVTGRIVDSLDEAVEAVYASAALSRVAVRTAWEKRFTARVMANRYVALYERLLGIDDGAGQAEPAIVAGHV
jgi:glycosyltransferase involved in cell wall biosynthesis